MGLNRLFFKAAVLQTDFSGQQTILQCQVALQLHISTLEMSIQHLNHPNKLLKNRKKQKNKLFVCVEVIFS